MSNAEHATIPRLGLGDKILQPRNVKTVAIVALGGTAAQWPGMWNRFWREIDEVWTINMGCFSTRSDLNFSCHTLRTMLGFEDPKWTDPQADLERQIKFNTELVEMLAASKVPQVTLDGSYDSFEYPLYEVVKYFGSSYFMNGLAYAIAYAAYCGVHKIIATGWEFEEGKFWEQGRCSVEYWMGRAEALGIKFLFPPDTTFADIKKRREMGIYGYGYQQPFESNGNIIGFASPNSADEQKYRENSLARRLDPSLHGKNETEPNGEPCP